MNDLEEILAADEQGRVRLDAARRLAGVRHEEAEKANERRRSDRISALEKAIADEVLAILAAARDEANARGRRRATWVEERLRVSEGRLPEAAQTSARILAGEVVPAAAAP